jgi:hypothetical protein
MREPMQAVLDGTDPESVLVRVRNAEGVTFAVRKDYGRPLDYLRYRSKIPISDVLYLAGEFYASDYAAISQVGSNTQSTIDALMRSVPWTAEDKRLVESGRYIHPKGEAHEAADQSMRMVSAAWSLKRVDERLDGVLRELLRDLLVRELTVGMIAQRWRMQPDSASTMLRYALMKLSEVYEQTRKEFADYARQARQQELEAEVVL